MAVHPSEPLAGILGCFDRRLPLVPILAECSGARWAAAIASEVGS